MFNPNEIRDPTATPTRVHFAWTELEEFHPQGGMWAIPTTADHARWVAAAAALMARPPDFAEAMRRVLVEWPRSVGVALTTPGLNRRAWLGHAGCYLATGSPEQTTRLGWHELDDGEQYAANAAADRVAAEWKRANPPAVGFGMDRLF